MEMVVKANQMGYTIAEVRENTINISADSIVVNPHFIKGSNFVR